MKKLQNKTNRKYMQRLQNILIAMSMLLSVTAAWSCSESDDENTEEYANWQVRNEGFFATLEDSLKNDAAHWKKIKCYTKDEKTPGQNYEYIYAKVLEASDYLSSPIFTDTVRVAYRGRLLPSLTYSEGYVFDQTYVGKYNFDLTSVIDGAVSSFTSGFATALLHMHKEDRWLIYVPHQLAYGASGTTGIPAYSTLIFDVTLIDFTTGDGDLYPWNSRELLKGESNDF